MNITAVLCRFIATLGPVGSLPMPGTMGTLCALPLLMGLHRLKLYTPHLDEGVLVGLFLLISVWIINQALVTFGWDEHDPSEIILDEVVGFLVTMLFLPITVTNLVLAFIYFRFFDIIKPFGIDRLEGLGGGWGIILDDVAAAIWARILLDITLFFIVQ